MLQQLRSRLDATAVPSLCCAEIFTGRDSHSPKLTWHPKMDGWKTTFLLGRPIFRCYVSFRECNYQSIMTCLQTFANDGRI